jgi:hypothetical protein
VTEQALFDTTAPAAGDASDLATLVAALASAREQVMKILRGLDAAGWLRQGVSPSRGALTVEAYARSTDAHDTEHLRQIQDHSLDAFDASLAGFERARAETLAFLRALPPHDVEHLAQMAACRAASASPAR